MQRQVIYIIYESLNVFALDDTGALYRVFFMKSDVGADKFSYLPATTVGKAVSIALRIQRLQTAARERQSFFILLVNIG